MLLETLPLETPSTPFFRKPPVEASVHQIPSDPKPIQEKLPLQFCSSLGFRAFSGRWWVGAVLLWSVVVFGVDAQEIETVQSPETRVELVPSAEPDEPVVELSNSRIEISTEVEEVAESKWWVEVTPLVGDAAPSFRELNDPSSGDAVDTEAAGEVEPLAFESRAPTGPAMICFGAPGFGVSCKRHFLYRSVPSPGPGEQDVGAEQDDLDDSASAALLRRDIEASDLTVMLEPVRGRSTVGRVIQEGLPVVGARIYLIPEGLMAGRPFTVPFAEVPKSEPASSEPDSPQEVPAEGDLATEPQSSETQPQGKSDAAHDILPAVARFVRTDDQGQFEIPPMAAGDYVLEAHLPTAQLHRVAFALPEPDPLEDPAAPEAQASQFPFQLGDIDVPAGLRLEVRAIDQSGGVIEGARVLARQGFDPRNWTELRALSDGDGLVSMSGLSAELPVMISCDARGFVSWQQEFELLPVSVDCELSELASVVGVVSTADFGVEPVLDDAESEPEAGSDAPSLVVTVSAEHAGDGRADDGANGSEIVLSNVASSVADAQGNFELHGLSPGDWRLTLAAPGFEPWVGEIELEAGQLLDIGLIFLPAASTLTGRVVAAEDGSPIAGASIQVIEPEGLGDSLSNEQGEFQVSAVGDLDLVLRVASPDRPAVSVVWDSAAQKASDLEPNRTVSLGRGGWIRAIVGDASSDDGLPCSGCALSLVQASVTSSAPVSGRLLPIPSMETDSRGEALSVALAPGGYFVEKPRFDVTGTTVVETRDAERKFVRVEADEMVTVRFDTGRPLFQLQLLPAERAIRSQVIVHGEGTRQRAIALGNGLFELRRGGDLPPDVFLHRWNDQTQFDEQIYLGALSAVDGPAVGSGTALGVGFEPTADPEEAELATVTMELSASVVTGRLETISEEPVSNVRIRFRDVADNRFLGELQSHDDGTFRIEDMAPGVYSLVIGERAYQFVSISAGRSVDLGVFQLIPGAY